jgi:4-hydroxybenzoyl-CoA thioesterase
LGLHYRIYVDERLCVDARTTTTCIDADKLKSQPVPQDYRAYFERIYYPE